MWFEPKLNLNYVCTLMMVCCLQLIYDVQDEGGSIGLLSTTPEKWTHLRDIGVDIPTMK